MGIIKSLSKLSDWNKAKKAEYKASNFAKSIKDQKDTDYVASKIKKRDNYKTVKTAGKTLAAAEIVRQGTPKAIGIAKQYEVKKKADTKPSAVKKSITAAKAAVNTAKAAANKKQAAAKKVAAGAKKKS